MKIDLNRYFKKGDRVAVAVSGGRDSMCLLHYLSNFGNGIEVYCVNIEHGIRGETSLKDSLFVANYCKDNNISLFSYSVKTVDYADKFKLTIEEAARQLRYDCFKDVIEKGKADYIAVAHHNDDQCETLFMRLMRGTGIYGLTGISDIRDYIVRPLLSVDGNEIDSYLDKHKIPYIKDESNDDNTYTRNYIRNEIFPQLENKFSGFKQSLTRLQRTAREYSEMLEGMSAEIVKSNNSAVIKVSDISGYKALSKYNILKTFKTLGVFHDIEERHLELILSFKDSENGARLDMPYGVRVYKEYGALVFVRDEKERDKALNKPFVKADFEFDGIKIGVKKANLEGFNKEKTVKETHSDEISANIDYKKPLFFDGDKIPNGTLIRYRREGDKFTSFNGKSKLLSDYLTDKKIPRRVRDNLVNVAYGDEVLLILGIEISNKIKIDNNTKEIFRIAED